VPAAAAAPNPPSIPAAVSKLFLLSCPSASPASPPKPRRSRRLRGCSADEHRGCRRLGELALSQSVLPCCYSPLRGLFTVPGSTAEETRYTRAGPQVVLRRCHPSCLPLLFSRGAEWNAWSSWHSWNDQAWRSEGALTVSLLRSRSCA